MKDFWEQTRRQWYAYLIYYSASTSIQFDTVLMLLVAISWTYSSSCKQSTWHWSQWVLQAVTAHQLEKHQQLEKDLVTEKLADVREDSPAWQDQRRVEQKRGEEKTRRESELWKERKETKEGGGSTMWVKCYLCWYFVVALGGMAEGPVTTNMGDFKPNKQRVECGMGLGMRLWMKQEDVSCFTT